MALSTEFDLEYLLAPFPSENPAGVDLRADDSGADLRAIKDARDEARRIERQADLNGEEPVESWQYWRTARDVSIKVLAEQSKDLDVASYLIESLVRTDGFAGLAQGLHLLRNLVQDLWDHLHPLPEAEAADEESRLYERLRPLVRLNGIEGVGLLPPVLARVPITEGATLGPFACWHYRQATELSKRSPEEQERRIGQGAVSMEQFNRAVLETSPQFFGQLLGSMAGCQAELQELDGVLTEKCGNHSPSWTAVREELEECTRIVRQVSQGRLPAEEAIAPTTAANSSGAAGAAGGLATREDAFRLLDSVAAFFERMDPQSLLALQLRKMIRLGRMTPEEYYREMLEDESAREKLFKLVGIKQKSSDGS